MRYRLPDKLGGHTVSVIHTSPSGDVSVVVDLGDDSFPMRLPATVLVEVPDPLPTEPPIGAVVLVDGDAVQHAEGVGGPPWFGMDGQRYRWAQLCDLALPGTPVLLVPAPEPVDLPWTSHSDAWNRRVTVTVLGGGPTISISKPNAPEVGAYFDPDELLAAIWTAKRRGVS